MTHEDTTLHDKGALDISVVVCTYNRANSLQKTLQCLARQLFPSNCSWEVIIVDNNSSDHTRDTVSQFASERSYPPVRYEFEGRQGLSNARNHGIECARGRIIAFTDDDVCPEPEWLWQIVSGMAEFACDACGGYIAPDWEAPPPPWLTERFYGFLAVKTDNDGPRRITSRRDAPFGANIAFRKSTLEKVGGFDPARGRIGQVLAGGEEIDLLERIMNDGGSVYYLPQARVHHRIEVERLTKRYFRRWRYQSSRNIAQRQGAPGNRHLWGIPLYIFPQLLRAFLNVVDAKLRKSEDETLYREMIVCHFLGLISGLYSSHRGNRS